MGKIEIALLAGGWSSEREISLKGGNAVVQALNKGKYEVQVFDPKNDMTELIEQKGKISLAFILLHGKFGEDGRIQGFLDILGIPYVGSGVLSSAMAVNKKITKAIYMAEGMTVPKDVLLTRGGKFSVEEIMEIIGNATVVKPLDEGSSLGMSVCSNAKELLGGIEKAFKYGREIMIEEYIDGREVTCCVLGNSEPETLPLVEIVPKEKYRFFDYDAKYIPGATEEKCPAPLSGATTELAGACGKKAHQALGCSVWSRTDMIIRDENIYLLETNTIPGMTENSLFPLAARAAGLSFSDLLDKLIALSLDRVSKDT
ncbi:MAG: D-alanine--D-alanine ligase [Deltaproteobacteria bacterium]|nr:D-alanine--D-alanine ligase [Deltaproteobacteria bacterium]